MTDQTSPPCTTEAEQIVGLAQLVTELQIELAAHRQTVADLIRARNDAESACHAKCDLMAQVSHEIRTQLQMLSGTVDLLGETNLDAVQSDYLAAFRNANELLLSLVNDLLDSSRLEGGRLQLERMEFATGSFMDATVKIIAWQAGTKGLAFDLRMAPGIPDNLIGDPKRLQQVLLNLAGNAIKFTQEGKIALTVAVDPATDTATTTLRFAIEDTGIGIPTDKLATIFDSYEQASPETARLFGGTGLGLSIARELVHMMGGEILAMSREGEGSRFVFTVRLEVPSNSLRTHSPDSEHANPPPERSLHLLIAEDAGDIRMLLCSFLASTPHKVDIVKNGEEALNRFMKERYDLVLMDMQMPVLDGYTATRRIREWEKSNAMPPVPVVALTASAERSDYHKSQEAGCTTHLSKPIRKETLLRTIREVTRQ
ncbi:MAG: response regulator [Desulfuromonadales bacterium]|nr:MAG: response regulator [Desulfuromonadales bacterium]